MNPQGGVLGHGSRFGTDIPRHIQWLAAMAADFAAMAAEAAVSAPEYAEEYSLIAQAAEYGVRILMENGNGIPKELLDNVRPKWAGACE